MPIAISIRWSGIWVCASCERENRLMPGAPKANGPARGLSQTTGKPTGSADFVRDDSRERPYARSGFCLVEVPRSSRILNRALHRDPNLHLSPGVAVGNVQLLMSGAVRSVTQVGPGTLYVATSPAGLSASHLASRASLQLLGKAIGIVPPLVPVTVPVHSSFMLTPSQQVGLPPQTPSAVLQLACTPKTQPK